MADFYLYRTHEHSAHSFAQHLKKSVTSCLMEAQKHKLSSIAMPAISCGVFGGDADLCAKLIVKAITDFFGKFERNSILLKRVSFWRF